MRHEAGPNIIMSCEDSPKYIGAQVPFSVVEYLSDYVNQYQFLW